MVDTRQTDAEKNFQSAQYPDIVPDYRITGNFHPPVVPPRTLDELYVCPGICTGGND